ncbi:hypothetical protein SLS62_001498 [Diatrype stigma]|uniref:Uncharacterized protein n=1 Tax=Diatrype stigma TaxID=117547 RepID=A0AAN9V043_9PEZI
MTYCDWLNVVLDCHSGYQPSRVETFRFRQDPVPLPLYSAEDIDAMLNFYRIRLNHTQNTNLARRRKLLHDRLCQEMTRAYKALYIKEPCEAGIEYFTVPLKHIQAALRWAIKLRDYDEAHPVNQSELSFAASDGEARKCWRRFKLDGIRHCLLLLVQLLELMVPQYHEFWEEAEESLGREDWHTQFIYDSKNSQDSTLREHPRMSDVLWHDTSPSDRLEGLVQTGNTQNEDNW